MHRTTTRLTRTLRAVCALTLGLSLAACGSDTGTPAGESSSSSSSTSSSSSSTSALTLTDGWVKATGEDMTGAFGTLKNTGDEDVVLTGGTSDLAGMVEMHVMTKDADGQMVMTKAEEGHTIPAGGELVLEPGGAHIMLMELTDEVVAGEDYEITVTTKDGEEIPLTFAGREFSGADEKYSPDSSASS